MPKKNTLTSSREQKTDPTSALRSGASDRSSQGAMGDSEVLLSAVQTRLRTIADHAAGTNAVGAPANGRSERLSTEVLEVVNALGALQSTLTQELGRCRQLERELLNVRAQLARSDAELAATGHGESRARHSSTHDSLTALPNRLRFSEWLDQALASLEPAHPGLGVLYLDLDGFKSINDRHGHHTGDEVLKIVAARLRRALRAQDMVCRMGGDEFACVLTDLMSRKQLEHLACKLFDTISAPMQIGECELIVRASIGIATCPPDGATSAALLKHADVAMYCAKSEQTGYAFYRESAERWVMARAPAPAPLRVVPGPTGSAEPPGQLSIPAGAATTRRAAQV